MVTDKKNPTIGIRFTPTEIELLDALMAAEERNRSDVVRRAVRAYADQLGIRVGSSRRKSRPQR